MSPLEQVISVGRHYGMDFENRSVSGDFVWNGKNLGLYWQKWQDDGCDTCKMQVRLNSIRIKNYYEYTPALCSHSRLDLTPDEILHEVGHYIVSPDWVRDLPEYGLNVLPGEYNANGGYHLHKDDSRMEGLFDDAEQNRYEAMANLVGYVLMARLGIRPPVDYTNQWVPTYKPDGYERSESEKEIINVLKLERSWCVAEIKNYGFSEDETLAALRFHGARY